RISRAPTTWVPWARSCSRMDRRLSASSRWLSAEIFSISSCTSMARPTGIARSSLHDLYPAPPSRPTGRSAPDRVIVGDPPLAPSTEDAHADHRRHRVRPVVHAELSVDRPQVGLHRLLAHDELGGDVAVAQSVDQQGQDLALALADRQLAAWPHLGPPELGALEGDAGGDGGIDDDL